MSAEFELRRNFNRFPVRATYDIFCGDELVGTWEQIVGSRVSYHLYDRSGNAMRVPTPDGSAGPIVKCHIKRMHETTAEWQPRLPSPEQIERNWLAERARIEAAEKEFQESINRHHRISVCGHKMLPLLQQIVERVGLPPDLDAAVRAIFLEVDPPADKGKGP